MTTSARNLRSERFVGALLAAAMWLTRSHHFATLTSLPDASWAAFFVAGLLGTRWPVPAALLLNAVVIDYLALLGGVSDYCVTPAYPFLAPTYFALWAAGSWAALQPPASARSIARTALALAIGVAAAFLISNASFYALAGYFDAMPALRYAESVARYFPSFLESTAIYTLVAVLVSFAWRSLRATVARAATRHTG